MRAQGSLIKWNTDRGFGFAKTGDTGIEVFVHISAFPRSGRQPQIGDPISFEIVSADDGRKQAKAVIYEVPSGRADFTLAPIKRAPAERISNTTPARTSAPRPDHRIRRREPHPTLFGRLYTLLFGALLIVGIASGYRKFLDARAVAVDTLNGQDTAAVLPLAVSNTAAAPAYRCDGREHCSQMHSCVEATWFTRHCPNTKMDGDSDGIPCEQDLCN